MFDQIAILAPGLLGASVARAAGHFGVAKRIVLWARRPEVRLQLKEQPWCDRVVDSPVDAVKGAQLVVICAPVDQIVGSPTVCRSDRQPHAIRKSPERRVTILDRRA